MFKKIIPFSFIALMVGFMACSSSSPFIKKAQESIKNSNYDAAIAAADSMIQKKPNNSIGYYYKGVASGQKGQAQEPPSEGTPYFKQMNEAFSTAKSIADTSKKGTPDQIKRIPSVKKSFWRTAHNKAVNLIKNDSLKATVENPLQRALAFINNAIIIQPTHAMSYQVKAILSSRNSKYGEAAKAQKEFINMTDSVTVRNYLLLTQYYRRAEMPEEALQAALNAQKQFPQNSKVTAFLADAYTKLGKTEKAITLVEKLVKQNPENPQYHLSLGSRLLIASSNIQNKFKQNSNKIFKLSRELNGASESEVQQTKQTIQSLRQENKELVNEIMQLQNRAKEQFNAVLKYKPSSAKAYHNLGVIAQNKAAIYYKKRNLSTSQSKAKQYDKKADDLLNEAKTYYQKAVQLEPNNANYWRRLYIVYTNLGLDEKANKAAKKAGISK